MTCGWKLNGLLEALAMNRHEQPDKLHISWITRWKLRNAIVWKKCMERLHMLTNNLRTTSKTADLLKVWKGCYLKTSSSQLNLAFFKCLSDRTCAKTWNLCKWKYVLGTSNCASLPKYAGRKPFVTGKQAKPHCIKELKNLSVEYKRNSKAWMICSIF